MAGPICPSLPSIQVLLLSSFAADILLLHPLSFHLPSPSPRVPTTPFHRPSPLFLSLSLVPLGSSHPLPPLFIFLLFLFSLLFGPVPSSTPGETHKKKIREGEKERRELYQRVIIGEKNKTPTESRARLFWSRGCCLFAPLYFIANLSALPSTSVPPRLLASVARS